MQTLLDDLATDIDTVAFEEAIGTPTCLASARAENLCFAPIVRAASSAAAPIAALTKPFNHVFQSIR